MKGFFNRHGINIVYILVFALILLFFIWATYDYQKSLKNNLLSEARIIAYQTRAIKSYIQRKQEDINKDASGEYEFKGIHPDVAIREIADILKSTSYFAIRNVSLKPRNDDNIPDKFESDKLKDFKENPGLLELYDSGSIGGHKVFRYIAPLRADPTCMPCHGAKKGEIDITGYKKEGYKVGDVIGGLSIIIQSYGKYQLLRRNMSVLLIFIFLLTFAIGLIIHNVKINYEEKLAKAQRKEKIVTDTVTSDTFNAQLNDKFHRLMMHNLRNPIGDVISSVETLKDVPLNILESSLATANKISSYSAKIIELKKIEQGRIEVLLSEFDFGHVFRMKLKTYENTARKKSVKFEGKAAIKMPKIMSDKDLLIKAVGYIFLFVLKFTKKQTGTIDISSNHGLKDRTQIVTIANDAHRISDTSESMIFEKFADIFDVNGNFMFNSGVDAVIAKSILRRLDCELSFDVNNKEKNVFNITIPVRHTSS